MLGRESGTNRDASTESKSVDLLEANLVRQFLFKKCVLDFSSKIFLEKMLGDKS